MLLRIDFELFGILFCVLACFASIFDFLSYLLCMWRARVPHGRLMIYAKVGECGLLS